MAESEQLKTLALPAVIDLDALDDVRDRLVDAIESGPVQVDGRAVERVSTNALLMLISAAQTARRNSFGFTISGASAPMLQAIDRLGLLPSFAGLMKG
ncbi:MAG: STAS domain-containing protein [Devosia sp.]